MRGVVLAAVLLVSLAFGLAAAAAHVIKQSGPFEVELGWGVEPPQAGAENLVEVTVSGAGGAAVAVPAGALSVEVIYDGKAVTLPLTPTEEPGVLLFHAGTDWSDGALVTAGGRVLSVTGLGRTRRAALARAYEVIENIHFDGMQYRNDIGRV